eukprot:gene10553-22012_t
MDMDSKGRPHTTAAKKKYLATLKDIYHWKIRYLTKAKYGKGEIIRCGPCKITKNVFNTGKILNTMPSYQRVNDGATKDVGAISYQENDLKRGKLLKYGLGFLASICAAAFFLAASAKEGVNFSINSNNNGPKGLKDAEFDDLGRYIMEDFDQKKPMANFLSGLGGIWGIPMWAFYVNRGQGVTAFGMQNKDGAIAKFNTAEKAYQQTAFTGFRTFVKGQRKSKKFTHMPFFPLGGSNDEKPTRKMIIGMNEMEIEEVSKSHGLQTNVLYYTVPNEDFPALVRRTTFTNLDKNEELTIEALDGLGRLIPSGLSNGALDGMGRTMEAWMNVYNLGAGTITQPFFHISQGTADTAQVQMIKDGHFVVAFEVTEDHSAPSPLPFVVDPSLVFGVDTTLTDPSGFFGESTPTLDTLVAYPQGTTSRTPCSFAGITKTIPPGGSVTIISVYGHAASLDNYLNTISPIILGSNFAQKKRQEASELVEGITAKVDTTTSSPIFNAYIKQSFLDNVLRGGLPTTVGSPANAKVYHIYSRIHGDLERDYNFYQLDTTYFSQGPGNFRDVNQNRRVDVLHTPAVGDFNVRMFLSFVQADGYNPLTVASTLFKVPAVVLPVLVPSLGLSALDSAALTAILTKPFRPGQLFADMAKAGITITMDRKSFLDTIMDVAVQSAAAQYAQNGYWADHWTYTLDLVDNYLSVFPDKEESMLYDSEPVPFYMSPAIVKSRADRYNLMPKDPSKPNALVLRVYGAVAQWGEKEFPAARMGAMANIMSSPGFVGDAQGPGGVWQQTKTGETMKVSAISKLAILGILKFSTLDPSGMGVEMEGGKPGWNDAMNGLPGILGSGMPETYEFLRILNFVASALKKFDRAVSFPIEFSNFLNGLKEALTTPVKEGQDANLQFWNDANDAREAYRAATVAAFDGATESWAASDLFDLITAMQTKTKTGIAKAVAMNDGLSPTYFYHECSNFVVVVAKPNYKPNSTELLPGPPPGNKLGAGTFSLNTLPLFLEGPVRHLKVIDNIEERREVYRKTKESPLYDSPLKMFLISDSLKDMGQDVGRMKAFSPGWLENQSVWLHMSYKFYLELLRGGLYSEFFEEMKTGLVPFMDNEVYGRSPLEAASFIVSSAFPDAKLHGASFLARLSGSTAEFLSMWTIMFFGAQPFTVGSDGTLVLALRPVIPGWMFTEEKTVTTTFLGAIKVTYHNPLKVDTWTVAPKSGVIVTLDGREINSSDAQFVGEDAKLVRSLGVKSIDIFY